MNITAVGQCLLNAEAVRSTVDPDWVKRTKTVPRERLKLSAQQGLQKVKTVLGEVLNNSPLSESSSVKICAGRAESGLCETHGNARKSVILFNPKALEDISGHLPVTKAIYLNCWLEQVRKLPNDVEELKSRIEAMEVEELGALMGFYRECAFCFDADEVYFILKHELAHINHWDNEQRLALRLTAAAAAIVFLRVYSESFNPFFLYLFAALSLIAPSVLTMKLEHPQEFKADMSGIDDDSRALRGAKSYFKKMAVYELATDQYYKLTGKVFNSGAFVVEKMCHEAGLGHPSALTRFARVMSI